MMNVAVDWYTNPHTVDNGGHGYSLEGMLVLRSVILREGLANDALLIV